MSDQMFVTLIGFFSGLAVLFSVTRVVVVMLQRRRGPTAVDAAAIEEIRARLTRIEQVTDATAIELERIGEGQRFTTKLLSEKSAGAAK